MSISISQESVTSFFIRKQNLKFEDNLIITIDIHTHIVINIGFKYKYNYKL